MGKDFKQILQPRKPRGPTKPPTFLAAGMSHARQEIAALVTIVLLFTVIEVPFHNFSILLLMVQICVYIFACFIGSRHYTHNQNIFTFVAQLSGQVSND